MTDVKRLGGWALKISISLRLSLSVDTAPLLVITNMNNSFLVIGQLV